MHHWIVRMNSTTVLKQIITLHFSLVVFCFKFVHSCTGFMILLFKSVRPVVPIARGQRNGCRCFKVSNNTGIPVEIKIFDCPCVPSVQEQILLLQT